MWLLTNFGYFSIVQKLGDSDLTVRSRVQADLEALRERYLPSLSPTVKGGGDYPYRAKASHAAVAEAAVEIVRDIHYPNFKNSVAEAQGDDRSGLYHEVWGTLRKLKDEPKQPSPPSLSGGSGDNAAAANQNESVSAICVSIAQLMNDFDENQVAANMKYKGKAVRVEGIVQAITVKDDWPRVYLSSQQRHPVYCENVACCFKDSDNAELAQLSKGSLITVEGDCGDMYCETIWLANCRLIKGGP
jgi:hypothetical protein